MFHAPAVFEPFSGARRKISSSSSAPRKDFWLEVVPVRICIHELAFAWALYIVVMFFLSFASSSPEVSFSISIAALFVHVPAAVSSPLVVFFLSRSPHSGLSFSFLTIDELWKEPADVAARP